MGTKKKDKKHKRHHEQAEEAAQSWAQEEGAPETAPRVAPDSKPPVTAAQGVSSAQGVNPAGLAMRLNSVSLRLLRRLHQEDGESGMTGERLSALSVLVYGGPRTLGKLAEAEGVAPPTMTRLVAAMERIGLVERTRHESDGRSIVVRATPRGEEMLLNARRQRIGVLSRALATLPDEDAATLSSATEILEQLLEERLTHDS